MFEAFWIPRAQADLLVDVVKTGMGGHPWLPDPPQFTNDAYLGEIGRFEPGRTDGSYDVYGDGGPTGLRPVPGSASYVWESQARDGSLRESAILDTPNPLFISAHGLRWDGKGGRWLSGDRVIAEYHKVDGQGLDRSSVMLFDEDLLRQHLEERELVLVVRLRGAREVYQIDKVYQPWMEIHGVGLLDGEWRFEAREVTRKLPAR